MITGLSSGGLKTVVRISFGSMVGLGSVFIVISGYTLIFFKKFIKSETLHKIYIWLVPLPYLAIIFGWMVTEFGRQPWIIYQIMEVSDGISIVPVSQVWFSIISLVVLYAILFVMDYVLTISRIKKGIIEPNGGEDNE
jgi:cytochrome d ubiquinol oxidase subunit I